MFRARLKQIFLFTVIVFSFNRLSAAAFPANNETLKFPVKDSLTGNNFNYSLQLNRTTPFYKVYKLRFPAPVKGKALFGDVTGFYYVPSDLKNDSKPRPGVVCLHISGGNGALTNIICAHLASNGIPAMMCHFPMFADRRQAGSRSSILSSPHGCRIFGQALLEFPLDARRTVDILLSRPEINPDKVNMLGTSLGGIIASTAAGNDPRINKAALLLAGGDLHGIIYNASRETKGICNALDKASHEDRKFLESVFKKIDPLNNTKELQKLAKRNHLIIINASNDKVIPPVYSQKLVDACGLTGKNIVLQGLGHYTAIAGLPKILNRFVKFFSDDTVPPRQALKLSENEKIIQNTFFQFYKLFQFKAPKGKCIYICATFKTNDNNGKTLVDGAIEIVRGDDKQFKLLIKLKKSPLGRKLTNLNLGCDPKPWIISSKGTLYSGQLEPQKDSFPAKYFISQVIEFQQLVSGIFSMAAGGMLTPLSKWVKVEMKIDSNKQHYVEITSKKDQMKIYLDSSNRKPQKVFFKSKRNKTEIVFTQWDLAAPASPGIFSPPDNQNRKIVKVKQHNVDKMLAAIVNFAVVKAKK